MSGVFLATAVVAAALADVGAVVTVSPCGEIRTLESAVDKVREMRVRGLGSDRRATIELEDGIYLLERAVELDSRDANIVIRAKNRGKAVLSGALALSWRKAGPEAPDLVPATSRGHLLVADIPGKWPIPGFAGGEGAHARPDLTDASLSLFHGESRLPLARYPNEGFVYTGEILGTNNMAKIGGTLVSHDGRFRFYDRAKLDAWSREPDLWTLGYWHFLWADHRAKVVAVKPSEGEIAVDNRQDTYGFESNKQFYVFNAFSELDRTGEWALDRKARRVFVWPRSDEPGEPYLAMTETLVSATNAANVVFDGLVFECARRDALVFCETSNVTMRASLVRHTGRWAVRYEGGCRGRVVGCDMYDLGEGGVYLRGGDHDTLAPGGHVADNNHIHHYGRVTPNSRPAVRLEGVGNRATHNLVHNSNHQAFSFDGNDHYIGFNVCHDICEYNWDAGAIYGYMLDWSKRGTVIEYNVVHMVGNQPRASGCSGVYLDAYSTGVTIRHNIFSRMPDGVCIYGGQDNSVYGNVFLNCRRSILRFTLGGCTASMKHCWGKGRDSSLFKSLTRKLDLYRTPLWTARYPNMLKPLDFADADLPRAHDALWCVVTNNAAYASGPIEYTCHGETGPYTTFADNSRFDVGVDPGFVDYAGFDWNLRPGSELLGRIGPTRFDEMGLYASEERFSPAVRHGEGMRRPRPLEGEYSMSRPAIDVDVDGADFRGGKCFAESMSNFRQAGGGRRIESRGGESDKDAWKPHSCSFVPAYDCEVRLMLHGGSACEKTLYDELVVKGAAVEDGGFETSGAWKVLKWGDDPYASAVTNPPVEVVGALPANGREGVYRPLVGNGMAAASNVMRVWQKVRVKKGVPVKISVKHRAYLKYFD
ncbi:MAG: right-handed parallel beta-helix repeat-containing protein [Kiritimatiellae bacterium]|nr:right-handed parallel beta-helix repeat-containing protein [Kiritimatiellia bacterium]